MLLLFFPPRVGAVHGDEGLVHEERPRLRPRILHHSTVHLQRPPGPERTDSTSKGHRGCKCSALTFFFCVTISMDQREEDSLPCSQPPTLFWSRLHRCYGYYSTLLSCVNNCKCLMANNADDVMGLGPCFAAARLACCHT